MRNIFCSLLAFLFISCTQQVCLKKSPSELVLTSIKSSQNKMSYIFRSNIPDAFIVRNYIFDVNATYQSNLKVYMNTKYSIVENSDSSIEIILLSCNQTVQSTNSGAQTTYNVLSALSGGHDRYGHEDHVYNNIALTTEINLKVVAINKGVKIEKSIFTTDEYNGNGDNVSVAQNSLDQAIGKSIIILDKFLSSF